MKILLEDCQLSNVYLRYQYLLERSDKYDIIVSINKLSTEILNKYKRILLVERMDSAGIGVKVRKVLDHPHIINCLKMYCMADRENHNKPTVSSRLFLNSLYPKAETFADDIIVSEKGFKKIINGFNFFHYDKFTELFMTIKKCDIKPTAERGIDLFYAGTVEYKTKFGINKYITNHRSKCVENIIKIGLRERFNVKAYSGRKFSYADYIRKMLDTKVILSPFGWGEYCHRDYEALLCGCILIKPKFLKVMQTPNIDEHVIQWANFNDFSDIDYNSIMAICQDKQPYARNELCQAKYAEANIIKDILK